MRHILLLVLALVAASPALADDPPRKPFPDDYVAQPCALPDTCVSFERAMFAMSAARMRGITNLDERWITDHWEEMHAALKPLCAKGAACFAAPGASFSFCNDALGPDMRATCDRYPAGSEDRNQCQGFIIAFELGRDQRSIPWWQTTQACVKASGTLVPRTYQPVVWMVPATIPLAYKGKITFYALDSETRLPVEARVSIEGTQVFSPAAPSGLPTTYYAFDWPMKLKRVANSDGHRDVVAPTVTISNPWYPEVKLPIPVQLSSMAVEMTPAAVRLRRGKNVVTITTRDAATGAPVEARVMFGEQVVGESNRPLTIDVPRSGKRPDIWVTSLLNHYSDVVIARAVR